MRKIPKLRVVFIGQSGLFTTEPIKRIGPHHTIVGLVESAPIGGTAHPDSLAKYRAARARKLYPEITNQGVTLQLLAERYHVPFCVLRSRDQIELIQYLRGLSPDVICVASMTQLLRKEAFSIPPLGTINMHPSLLPLYRGPNPWFWQYHEMEREGGVTIHFVEEGEDRGEILQQASFPIPLGMDFPEMFLTAVALGAELMVRALNDLAGHQVLRKPQRDLPCPIRARNVTPDEALIDFAHWPIERAWHVLRGTQLWLDPIPLPKEWKDGSYWRVAGFSREPRQDAPGTVSEDREGYYVSHRQGKIRLQLERQGNGGK